MRTNNQIKHAEDTVFYCCNCKCPVSEGNGIYDKNTDQFICCKCMAWFDSKSDDIRKEHKINAQGDKDRMDEV
jgi:hypothetical protein